MSYHGYVIAISNDKLEIVKGLYYESKFSARQIAEKLNVSVDAVYYFMRRNNLSRRTFSEENELRFERKPLSFKVKTNLSLKEEKLKTVGVAIYWGEGYKSGKSCGIDLANSDPEMIKAFLSFLRNICGIDESRLRILLYCYSNQNIVKLKKFWSGITKVPVSQFSKAYVRNDFKIGKENKMPFGMIHIRYADKKLLILVKKWIDECKKEFAQVDP